MKGLRSIAKVVLAAHAGFCFGVRRAVETAEQSAPTLGSIIHNPQVVASLAEIGVCAVNSTADVPEGARVVIRSHGVGRSEYDALQKKGCDIRDATCPFVKRLQRMAQEAKEAGTTLIGGYIMAS